MFFFQVLPASFPILSLLQESNLRRTRENRKLPQVSVSDCSSIAYFVSFADDIYRTLVMHGVYFTHIYFKKTLSERTTNGSCRTKIARPKGIVVAIFGMQKQ